MKKNIILIISFIFICFFLLIESNGIKIVLSDIVSLFLFAYIPSLFPFILLTNLFINSVNLNLVYNYFSKRKMNWLYDILIIFIGLITGMPNFALIIDNQINREIYSIEKGNNILESFGFISLPFIFLVTNKNIFFILILLSISIINLLINKNHSNFFVKKSNSLSNDSYKKSIKALLTIFIALTIFSLPLFIFIKYIPSPYCYYIGGLLESSYPSLKLLSLDNMIPIYFLMSFSSFSLIYQIKKINHHLYILSYIKKRLFIASLVTSLMIIFFY